MQRIHSLVIKISSLVGFTKGLCFAECMGADFSGSYESLLDAIERNHIKVVQYLIDMGVDIRRDNDFAVGLAAAYGNTELVRLLIIEGADFRASDQWALRWAAKNGHFKTVDFLLFMGADPTACGHYTILIAIESGHTSIVSLLLRRGCKVPNIQYHITRCGEKGYLELMKVLMSYSNKKVAMRGG